jgi:hypothetical protein
MLMMRNFTIHNFQFKVWRIISSKDDLMCRIHQILHPATVGCSQPWNIDLKDTWAR